MGKKKKGGGAEKTAEKTAKKEKKKLLKETQEDDIEEILKSVKAEEERITATTVDVIDGGWSNPLLPPRCNSTILPFQSVDSPFSSPTSLILFGGEHNDGHTIYVFGDLLLFNYQRNEVRKWTIPHPPPPRSAHCFVQTDGPSPSFFLFGGEFQSKSGEQFHHYKDLWRLAPQLSEGSTQWKWTEVKSRGGPSARSGSRAVHHKHRICVFGGFHDSGRKTEYFNDLFVFNVEDSEWNEVKKSTSTSWPSPRSGCCFWADEVAGVAYLYGGTGIPVKDTSNPKVKKTAPTNEVELLTYSDLWQLDLSTLQWTQLKKKGIFPAKRAGMAAVAVPTKQRAFLFGGVIDEGDGGNAKDSQKKVSKPTKAKPSRQSDDEDDGDDMSHSLYLNDLYMFNSANSPPSCHFIELKGDVVSRSETFVAKVSQKNADKEKEGKEEDGSNESSVFDFDPTHVADQKKSDLEVSSPPPVQSFSTSVNHPIPHPRLSPSLAVVGHHIILYGGVFESADDRQFVLNDWWMMDSAKGCEWKCVVELDDEKFKHIGSEDEGEEEAEEEGEEEEETMAEHDEKNEVDGEEGDDEKVSIEGKEEAFQEYFQRMKDHFTEEAKKSLIANDESVASSSSFEKEVRKVAFQLAWKRFREKPIGE